METFWPSLDNSFIDAPKVLLLRIHGLTENLLLTTCPLSWCSPAQIIIMLMEPWFHLHQQSALWQFGGENVMDIYDEDKYKLYESSYMV